MTGTFQALTATRLGDSAYAEIANALMAGRLKPGSRMTIRSLADSLGTSTTPVRDAVMRLIQGGVLEQRSPRDVRVPLLTEKRFREIIGIRVELEGMAAGNAAAQIDAAGLVQLRELIDRNEEAIRNMQWDLASSCNQKFHFAIVDFADMPVLRNVLEGLWLQTGPVVAGYYQRGGRTMIDEHYVILDALHARDREAAQAAMRRDVASSITGISRYISELSEDPAP